MRRLVVLLASTSAIFAGSTAYLLLKSSREQTVDRPPSAAQATTDAPIKPKVSAQPTEAAAAPAPARFASDRKEFTGSWRGIRPKEAREGIRPPVPPAGCGIRPRAGDCWTRERSIFVGSTRALDYLGLDDAPFDHMLELLAEQQIGMREALLKCSRITSARYESWRKVATLSRGISLRSSARTGCGGTSIRKRTAGSPERHGPARATSGCGSPE